MSDQSNPQVSDRLDDPTTPERDSMRAAWDEVSEGFTTLGRLIRDRYRTTADEPGVEPPGEERIDASGETEIRPASAPKDSGDDPADAFRKAFDTLIAAAKELGERASEITHSDEIRSQARVAGRSLTNALSQTVDNIVDDLGDLFRTIKTEVKERKRPSGSSDSARDTVEATVHGDESEPPVGPV